ncbi:MAG: NADH-quinone oxidoreductase subunit C [Verrucomicrobiota bacterium]
MSDLSELTKAMKEKFPRKIKVHPEFREEMSWTVPKDIFLEVMKTLKAESGFDMLLDICSIDNYGEDPRFEVVYELCCLETQQHLRVKVPISEDDAVLPTVVGEWKTANWHEREVYDMMGIKFQGHPDLRRILMWDGYPFFPLRKEFPLEGKETDMPDIAFSRPAPLEGGPFVTSSADLTKDREPRSKAPDIQ